MSYLSVKMENVFDWDDINVGNNQLDHSQNFFAHKHYEHEPLKDMDLISEQLGKVEVDSNDGGENKENEGLPGQARASAGKPTPGNANARSEDGTVSQVNVAANPTQKPQINIASQWSTQKRIVPKHKVAASKGAVSKAPPPPPPHAYQFKDVYQRKREEAERKRAEEDRKRREFHSRPVPNFSAYHEQLERRQVVHMITVAVTPMVLKKSRETEEKRRKKIDEWKRQCQPPKFEPRPPTVLKEEPFVPKKVHTVVQQRPFNLHSEKRLQERREYDAAAQRSLEEKQKQEEEERKKREEERIKELRKATTFKARPNPFK